MHTRIAELISVLGIKKADFARRLKISQPFASELASGAKSPSGRTINDICAAFGVNEHWLRTGQGEMFVKKGREDEIVDFMASLSKEPNTFKARLVSSLSRLDSDQWEVLEKIVDQLLLEKEGPSL